MRSIGPMCWSVPIRWTTRASPRCPVSRGAPYVRYYIGAPLRRLNGAHVGVLCVVDTRRRHPASPDQAAYLMGLARQASTALEARLDRQVRSRLA
ncbi:Uncharacterised protein [Sphingomonas paucimobilis]|nr:Uncharacterised protein [Sphingomonas paucimobilis]